MNANFDKLNTEVQEAVAKFVDISQKLEEALANAGDSQAFKDAVVNVSAEMASLADELDQTFQTTPI